MSDKQDEETLLNGQYRLLAFLGRGGFGEVLLAGDVQIPGRRVAIKMIRQSSNELNEEIIYEMKMLSKVVHPNVVSFYHYFKMGDQLCMVSEYCSRGNLYDAINRGEPVPLPQVFNWGLTLCEALSAIHTAGVTHHDIKPANIFLTEDGTLKLGDFGIANTLGGTKIYFAPEMLDDTEVIPEDPRPDIYALGITLIELLLGSHPFIGVPEKDALLSRAEQGFVDEVEQPWAREVLLKATHPIRELRFQTAAEFANAIRLKHVPDVFDLSQFKAHQIADRSQKALAKKKWSTARKLAKQSVGISAVSVSANVAVGRAELRVHNLSEARNYFERALHIDKRAQVQKELGWLKLESGRVSNAISLFTEHLRYVPDDMETYNLLLKCFYLKDRYDAGLDLLDKIQAHAQKIECFVSNRFLFELLAQNQDRQTLIEAYRNKSASSPFIRYNSEIGREIASDMKPKMLFQEYSDLSSKRESQVNSIALSLVGEESNRVETSSPIYSIGRQDSNDLRCKMPRVSGRHCAIVNLNQEVWIYDLESTIGTYVDGQRVKGRAFLLGVHDVLVGDVPMRIASSSDLLI
jgi:serine/threonine protein kinase